MNTTTWYFLINLLTPLPLAYCAWRVGKQSRRGGALIAAAICLALLARGAIGYFPTLEYRLFPWEDYLFFRNGYYALFPAFLLALMGQIPRPTTRRLLAVMALVLYAVNAWQVAWVMFGPRLKAYGTIDRDGVCRQSSDYSCGAASCVTLLRLHDIASDEWEMADLCLTCHGGGIFELGAMRGLKRKLQGKPLTPKFESRDYDALVALGKPGIISTKYGFLVNHMVCLLEITPTEAVLGDPLQGRVVLPKDQFLKKYLGNIIYLERG